MGMFGKYDEFPDEDDRYDEGYDESYDISPEDPDYVDYELMSIKQIEEVRAAQADELHERKMSLVLRLIGVDIGIGGFC